MKNGGRLLEVLLKVSEKAANIARACRQKDALFKLLVQEKHGDEKNPRFFQDFKTLADVLIQETIRHDIGIEFPELAKMVRGEETNVFSNTLGKTVVVEVCPTSTETTQLLAEVLDDDVEIAQLLASEIHKEILLDEVPIDVETAGNWDFDIDIEDLGIWIDPIDSTADYITGGELVDPVTGLHLGGLRCVTVLIGAYLKLTGLPVVGVVNQPFFTCENSQWKGHCYWGYVSEDGTRKHSFILPDEPSEVLLLGRNECPAVKTTLVENGFQTVEIPGAGYKILSVAIGHAKAYVLSKSTTFRWDTCAPQALLRSLGGGIIDYSKFTNSTDSEDFHLRYSGEDTDFANRGGLVAYRDTETLESLRRVLLK
ncbi:inositol polyphosphate 1-phosphatase [Venturia canescens]|uniref:inositol polyphosphate 1-phosphatase n=1 Tax=Venturia canescens TaxID=32260 RepID=UPI001C9CE0F6|nr:inositol polyphosphate 1-phosphatase [Venturia canescens]XP_043267285.1 inositol polyphosphate 1-phosphatase [Venturia canescens]XP_043267294.1 inositol polyphosphate 1-phosphatase [Venturia canescens]XP_043267303.1 inositol polyphosphate 1-phosphatase [Venturia canescens]XP_043267311.1 inositol polyphosphate 1-phosphatase [Venturia canescens]